MADSALPSARFPNNQEPREEMRDSSTPAWATDDEIEATAPALPRARRDVVTREAKLSLTDTIMMLRARGTQRQDGDSASTPHESIDVNKVPHQDVSGGDYAKYQSPVTGLRRPTQATVPCTSGATIPSFKPALPSLRGELQVDRPSRLLTLADTITIPMPRRRRPLVADSRPRRATSSTGSHENGSCSGDQCCTGPEYLVTAQPQNAWVPARQEEMSLMPSLDIRRGARDPEISAVHGPMPLTRLVHCRDSSDSQCCTGPEFVIRDQPRRTRPPQPHIGCDETEEKSPAPSRSSQASSEFGYAFADSLTVSKPRKRRPVTGRVTSHPNSLTRSRSDGNVEEDDDDRPCCLGPEYEIKEGMTHEEIQAVKKGRRKEQCRINQANYRKRKRALEMQTDDEIQQLQREIDQLEVKRENAERRARQSNEYELLARDPMNLVQQVFLRLSPTHILPRQVRAPLQQVDAIVGLGYEEFLSVDELLAQWHYHHTVFDVFELRLRSIQSEDLGESLVLSAEATLHSSIVARGHKRHRDYPVDQAIVVCPVVQRFVFDARERLLAKIISEVDWLAGLRAHTASPLALAAHLVESSNPHTATRGSFYA